MLLSSSDTSNTCNMNSRMKSHNATVVLVYATKPLVITTLICYFFLLNGLLPNWQKPVSTISLILCYAECSPTLSIFPLYVSFSFGHTTNDEKIFFLFCLHTVDYHYLWFCICKFTYSLKFLWKPHIHGTFVVICWHAQNG